MDGLDGHWDIGWVLATPFLANLLLSDDHPHRARQQRHWHIRLWLRLPAMPQEPANGVEQNLRWASMRLPKMWRELG